MTLPFAVATESVRRFRCLCMVKGHDDHAAVPEPFIEGATRFRAQTAMQDNAGLQYGDRRNRKRFGRQDRFLELPCLRFVGDHGEDGRRVQDHQPGSPSGP
jgi:hypothetical protein